MAVLLFKPIRWAFSALTSMLLLYVFFFVPIGERPLYDHVKRIARTPEAHDLERDLGHASERVIDRASHELRDSLHPENAVDRPDAALRFDQIPHEAEAHPAHPAPVAPPAAPPAPVTHAPRHHRHAVPTPR